MNIYIFILYMNIYIYILGGLDSLKVDKDQKI